MRPCIAIVLVTALFCQQALAQTTSPAVSRVLLKKGTQLKFSNLTPIDSRTAQKGDLVELRLEESLVIDGFILLEAGETVYARITKAKPARAPGKAGTVRLRIHGVSFRDGSKAKAKIKWAAFGNVPLSRDRNRIPPGATTALKGDGLGVIAFVFVGVFAWFWWDLTRQIRQPYPGPEYVLPAGSTIAVEITHNHYVRP